MKGPLLHAYDFSPLSWNFVHPYLIFSQQFTLPEGMGNVMDRQAQVVGAAFEMKRLGVF